MVAKLGGGRGSLLGGGELKDPRDIKAWELLRCERLARSSLWGGLPKGRRQGSPGWEAAS